MSAVSASIIAPWETSLLIRSLRRLILHRYYIIRQCARVSAVNDCLETLNLSWNALHGPGVVALCKGLQKNTCLHHLNLSHNGLGYAGSLSLSKLLKTNKTLKYLDVSNNNITWKGAVMIADGIKKNATLETLRVTRLLTAEFTNLLHRSLNYAELNIKSNMPC